LSIEVDGNMCFFSEQGKCYENHGQYKYKICMFEDSSQDSLNLGHWKDWSEPSSNSGLSIEKRIMKYTAGSHCWNGPARTMSIKFRCGANSELVEVEEPSKCEYAGVFVTPCACTEDLLKEAKDKVAALEMTDRGEL